MSAATYELNAHRLAAVSMLAESVLHRTARQNPPIETHDDHTPRYCFGPHVGINGLPLHRVLDRQTGQHVDTFRSRCAAEHAARMLNTGACTVEPHNVTGCRIVPRQASSQHNGRIDGPNVCAQSRDWQPAPCPAEISPINQAVPSFGTFTPHGNAPGGSAPLGNAPGGSHQTAPLGDAPDIGYVW
jgi:hypothetical protein